MLQQEKQNLEVVEAELESEKDKLEARKRDFEEKQRLLNLRNNTWWIFREIANFFDDRVAPYETAKGEVQNKQDSVQELQNNVQYTLVKVQATQEQINAFNNALFRFAIGCRVH